MQSLRLVKIAMLCTGASTLGLSVPAMAVQESSEQAGLEEIVVTANKREENLQQTPLAISAVSSEQLELLGLSETKDLSAIAPNVSIVGATTNATAAVVTIRGIPTAADETQGYDSPIGIYVDGIYMARSSASTFEVADIERVEVLRGPQGTLFGRNTTGGAINFVTKLPDNDASFALRLGAGNYGQFNARGILNSGTLGDALRMSLGFLYRKRNGTVDNLLEPSKSRDPGASETASARWAATIDLSDSIELTNIFDYTRITGLAGAQQLAALGDGTFLAPITIDGNTFNRVQPANVRGYLASATALNPECGTPLSQVSSSRLDSICNNASAPSTDTLWGNMTRLTADLGGIVVRSTTAFRGWRNTIQGNDIDGLGQISGPLFTNATTLNGMPQSTLALFLPAGSAAFLASQAVPRTTQGLFETNNFRRQKQFSQEIEIISDTGGSFEWVLGGFFFKESGYERNPQNFLFVLDTNQAVFTTANFGALAPLLQAGNPARYRGVPQASTLGYRSWGESQAVYGQGSYRFGGPDGALGVTLGMRYSWDKKRFEVFQNGAAPYTDPLLIALNTQKKSFSAPTGHLTVDYRASDTVNFYGRVARGYRSGGFNARQPTSVANNVGLIPFNEETITSYEAGFKTEFSNRLRLNGAVFYNVYKDQLVTLPIPITGGGSFGNAVVNAGKTNYWGLELEGRFALTDNFTIDGSFGYVKKSPKDFPQVTSTGANANAASVFEPGYAPNYTANVGATYKQELGGDANLTARIGYNYTSSFWMFGNPITSPFGVPTKGDARGLVDAQLKVDGINFGGDGQGLGITLWAKNLTDKEYVVRSVDFGQLGYSTTIYGDPRTFGVTLDMKF
ncbi:MAG: TonB-dependent receptor [Sphingorhabdus sp.]